MPYVCSENCGNETEFVEHRNYTAYGWEDISVDQNGEWIDCLDQEERDRESDIDEVECENCSAPAIWVDDIEEYRKEQKVKSRTLKSFLGEKK